MKIGIYLFSLCLIILGAQNSFGDGAEGIGGGNSLNGKLIESYATDIKKAKAYVEKVEPLLTSLEPKLPNVVKLYRNMLKKMDWYFIPSNLKPRSESITGLPFPSDQIAVQTFNEVWIDEDLFKSLSLDEQAKLILHEILLAELIDTQFDQNIGKLKTMKIVRSTTNTIYSSQHLSKEDIVNKLRLAGWVNECLLDESKCRRR